jgi:DNA repair protein RadD
MYELRPEYQLPAHHATLDHIRTSLEPAFHSQSVGAGKSINICFLAKHIIDKGGRCLVIARQGELIEQLAADYFEIGGKCSVYSASLNKKSTYYPCVMGTEGTIQREIDGVFKDKPYNVLIVDECHMIDWNDALTSEPESQYGKIIKHFKSLNPKLRIIGYTGSPFRGKDSIKGDFWKAQLSDVGTYELVNLGYLVPPVFGFADETHSYDLSEFKKTDEHADYSAKELQAMGRKITKDKSKTESIVEEMITRCANRLGVLITCASKKHCEQVAELLPPDSWGIITDSTSTKERRRILGAAKTGAIKYTLQIGCLTTGVNVPYWDVCVILRRIGSLTLLIQLVGRVLRTLKQNQIDEGIIKNDALILDYTDTFESMGDIFDHPITDMAAAAKASFNGEPISCPSCSTKNSQFAVRCIGESESSEDGRCEHFFKSSMCFNCMTENSPTARNCRKCEAIMIDPASALRNKAYTDADYKPVLSMTFEKTKTNALRVVYALDSTYTKQGIEHQEFAKELLHPFDGDSYKKRLWRKFVDDHIQGEMFRRTMLKSKTLDAIIKAKAYFDDPTELTHRVNEKGFSIINRKKFRSGREALTG